MKRSRKKHKKPLSALAFEYESLYLPTKTFAMWPQSISGCHKGPCRLIARFLELFGRKLSNFHT